MNYQASTHTETKTMNKFLADFSTLNPKLNIVVRMEMLTETTAHVTMYQPRKNILVDFVLTDADEVELRTEFDDVYEA